MYPDRDTSSNVPRSGYITARDQSMVESGVTEGGKTLPVFFFVNEHNNTNMKPQAKKQQLLDEVFVISRIIKDEVGVISRSRRLRLITVTEKQLAGNSFIVRWHVTSK